MTVLGDGKCAWEGLYEFLPYVLDDSEFLFRWIVFHVQDPFQLVTYCEVLDLLPTFYDLVLLSLIRSLLDVLGLAQFEVVEPALGLYGPLLDVLPRVILAYFDLMRHILT